MTTHNQQLILFPTVASPRPGTTLWSADIHGWCYDIDEDRHFQRTTAHILRRTLKISRHEPDPPFFRERAYGFVVDNRRKMPIEITHGSIATACLITKRNGHFRGVIELESHEAQAPVLTTQHGSHKTEIFARRSDSDVRVAGVVHLPGMLGLSVISDIDDTIKFSNVSNKRELLANTFIRSFRSIEGMPPLFQRLATRDVAFHYISATPWQLYSAVARFLSEHGFPEGSIHLRKFALRDATIFKKIFPSHKKKRKVIEALLGRFPHRKFLLIGDTGEKDPEMYGDVARRYPEQIIGICVRNVSPDAPESPRFRRAFAQVPPSKWIVYEDALRLEEHFLPELLQGIATLIQPVESPADNTLVESVDRSPDKIEP